MNSITKNFLIVGVSSILFSCENTIWLDAPPKEFRGVFFQVSDEVIQGIDKQLVVEIREKSFNNGDEVLPIVKVSRTDETIVLFCKDEESSDDLELLYELQFSDDNYLYIKAVVPTGYDDSYDKFPLGKFTIVDFLKPSDPNDNI